MKYIVYLFLFLFSQNMIASHNHTLEIDLNFKEYQKLWNQYKKAAPYPLALEAQETGVDPVFDAIRGGEKLFQWVEYVNSQRPEGKKFFITNPQTRRGIPIDQPKVYGPASISETFQRLEQTLPKVIFDVIYGSDDITRQFPMSDKGFRPIALDIFRLYSSAVRWQTVILPYKGFYLRRKYLDIRGYYFLKKISNLDHYLRTLTKLPKNEQERVKNSLTSICQNARKDWDATDCRSELEESESGFSYLEYKNKYWIGAKKIYDQFFEISRPRTDIQWTPTDPMNATIPFKNPQNDRIASFLKGNVEDEFQWSDWALNINYRSGGFGDARLKFESGVTPHVSGGNIIVMDQNQSLEEYTVQWVIRHEFGHILRLPDCYIEFYDAELDAAVNYQIDIKDLMCSRAGDMNERIYLELKKNYFQ